MTTTTWEPARNHATAPAANDVHHAHRTLGAAQRLARITGLLYLVIAVFGMFAGTVSTGLVVAGNAAATADKVLGALVLARGSLAAWIIVLVADVAVAITLLVLLKPVSARLSLLAAALRVAYAAMQGANLLNLLTALTLLTDASYGSGVGPEAVNTLALSSLEGFGTGFKVALIVFGAHLVVLGCLFATSQYVPRALGILVVAAGMGYIGNNLGCYFVPAYGGLARVILMVPAVAGELGLAFWLLVKGVQARRATALQRERQGFVEAKSVMAVCGPDGRCDHGLRTHKPVRSCNLAMAAREEEQEMKAMSYDKYGPFDDLACRDIEMPAIKEHEVLVRVHAAGLHQGDCFSVRGAPFATRLMTGLLKPKYGVPGYDLAGQVEAVGDGVTHFQPGDAVFGASTGTCAEYARAGEGTLARKPSTLTFQEAAAIPTSALTALRGLRDVGKVQPGQEVLINGASGGVGSFAVQLAKAFGADVTGVCSTKNVDLVRSLGADHVVDYTQEDFTQGRHRYDVIFDNVENHSLSDCRRVLTPTGTLILNSGTGAQGIAMLVRLVAPLALSPLVRQSLRRYVSVPNRADLVLLKEFVAAGKLRPVIDRTYPLCETPAALAYIEGGHARGKVVVTVKSGSR